MVFSYLQVLLYYCSVYSKRSLPYLPAFQVWLVDHPHPQNDVRMEQIQMRVCTNKNSLCVIAGLGSVMDSSEGNESQGLEGGVYGILLLIC